jgi:hypothetical protein
MTGPSVTLLFVFRQLSRHGGRRRLVLATDHQQPNLAHGLQ